jgi:hypothetical protein
VGRSRITAVGLVVVGCGLLLGSPADAHACAAEDTLDAGTEATIGVAVTGHDVPAAGVTIFFDESFEIIEVDEPPGWRAEIEGNAVEYTGGEVPPLECSLFDVVVRPTESGEFRVRPVLTLDDGTQVEHPAEGDIFGQEDGSQVVVNRNGPPNPVFEQVVRVTGDTSEGPPVLALVAIVLWGTIAGLGYLSWRQGWWRRPSPQPTPSPSRRRRPQPRRR